MLISGCSSLRELYPTGGAIVGGSVGAITGNPAIAGLTAGSGALFGEMAKGNSELQETKDKLAAVTQGDVKKIVELGLTEHSTGYQEFTNSIKNILMVAGALLFAYLGIPILLARKCAKQEAQKLTRAPFPLKPPTRK